MNSNQMMDLMNHCVGPIKTEIEKLRTAFSNKIKMIEDKMMILQNENTQLKEDSAILTDIIKGMQASLSRIDGEKRANNLIVSKIPEGKMCIHNEIDTEDDTEKIKHLVSKLDLEEINILENMEVSRIGQIKSGVPRLIKVKLTSSDIRNKILDKGKNLR